MMTVMTIPIEIERVAKALNLPLERLMQRSVKAFIRQEMRATQMDIADFQDRYSVTSANELRVQIEQGAVHSHPAWEDSIEWEHLESHLENLEGVLSEA